MKVRLLPEAYDDIDRLHAFLLSKNPLAATKIIELLNEAAKSLRDAPRKGRPAGRPFRDLVVRFGRSAYVMRYRVDDTRQVVSVARV